MKCIEGSMLRVNESGPHIKNVNDGGFLTICQVQNRYEEKHLRGLQYALSYLGGFDTFANIFYRSCFLNASCFPFLLSIAIS